MLEEIKTKRYTRLRLQRIVLNAILNVTKEYAKSAKSSDVATKALAVKSTAAELLALTNGCIDELTQRADRLYYSLSTATPPQKLIKID